MSNKMEQSIIYQLQKDEEQEIGPMPTKRGEVPSIELLFKFYRFYITKSSDNIDTKENMMLISLCSNSKKHVVKVAEKHYNLDYISFMNKFHDWNKINNSGDYLN
jgi:hypothetical protein